MIPIRNLYYLFLYSWDRFSEGNRAEIGADAGPDLPNLLAKVLMSGVRRQLRRGLDKGYLERVDELAQPRGKFLLQDTVRRSSQASGRAVCQFDDLTTDTLPNRIVKAAVRRLHQSSDITATFAAELRGIESRLEDVARISLTPAAFRPLQVTRNQSHYSLLMDVCRLVMELSLPDDRGVGHRFKNVLEDEVKMSTVFENFVRNFFRLEQKRYSVAAETIVWPAVCALPGQIDYLPDMITDVTLRSPNRIIVIDAKFYRQTFAISRFGSAPKVRSGHLYQLQSYLEHNPKPSSETAIDGVLLYPSTDGAEIDLDFQLPRHRMRVCTVDLSRTWQDVHTRLLAIAGA